MKIKTKNVKPNSSIEHRASSNAFCLLCFSFLSFCFLTSLVGAQIRSEQLGPADFLMPYLAQTLQDVNTPTVQMQDVKIRPIRQEKSQTSNIDAVNFAAEVNQKLPHRGSTIPGNLSSRLGRQLWRTRISVPGDEKDNRSKSELKRLIEQIRSIEFKPPKQTAEPVIILEPVARLGREPNETSSGTEAKEEPEKKTIESRLPYEPVTDQTLQMLGSIAQHLDQLDSPFELGEVLFFSGHLKEAAVFYQEALKRKSPDNPPTADDQDRAWILFQIGNCLRDDDLPTAKKMYRQLITEYPNSPWAYMAKAREELIDWYQKDKPRILIADYRLLIDD